jgi:hypothetical protein
LGRSSRSFRAKTKIDMPKTGEVQVAELQLFPIRPTTKADFDFVGCAEHDPVMRASVDETVDETDARKYLPGLLGSKRRTWREAGATRISLFLCGFQFDPLVRNFDVELKSEDWIIIGTTYRAGLELCLIYFLHRLKTRERALIAGGLIGR